MGVDSTTSGGIVALPVDVDATGGIPQPGDELLDGKYLVERVLGIGGMGVVVAALHKQLGGRVAFKFLVASMRTPEMIDRFLREGQAAVKIESDHVARVLDVGVLQNGTPYLMMEHLSGVNLDEYAREYGPLSFEEAIDFILQTCEALAVAHAVGVVHRDLKPSNLFVTRHADGTPWIKVLDFGISKMSNGDAEGPASNLDLTAPGAMLGSPRYMSPEQIRDSKEVDHRADIWALGVTLYQLVTGKPMFSATTVSALCAIIASDPAPRLRALLPHAPEHLERTILRCVEKDPAHRYSSVSDLASDLAESGSVESRARAARVRKLLLGYTSSGRGMQAVPQHPSVESQAFKTERLSSGRTAMPPILLAPEPEVVAPLPSEGNVSPLAVSNARGPVAMKRSFPILFVLAVAAIGSVALAIVLRGRATREGSTPAVGPSNESHVGHGTFAAAPPAATVALEPAPPASSPPLAAAGTARPAATASVTTSTLDAGARAVTPPARRAPVTAPPVPASPPAAPRPTGASEEEILNRRR